MITTPYFYEGHGRAQATLSISPNANVPILPWVGSGALSTRTAEATHQREGELFTPEGALNSLTRDRVFNHFLQQILALRIADPENDEEDLPATSYAVTNAIYVSLLPRMTLGDGWNMPHVATDGYGGIRMSWIVGDRELRAVIPPDSNSDTRKRYIYWDNGDKYGSIPNFSPSSLRTWLVWLQEENAFKNGKRQV